MKKSIPIVVILSMAMAFACSKKVELTRLPEPFMLVAFDHFVYYEDGAYEDIEHDYSAIEKMTPPIKKFREDGLKYLYYSELDSNTLVFITGAPVYGQDFSTTLGLFFIRLCSSDEECDDYEKKCKITDIFKYEFMRLQQSGFYKTTREYADSISDHIIERFQLYSDSTGEKIYNGLIYNDRCDLDAGVYWYEHNDDISESMRSCAKIPLEVRVEIDSCNAMLDAQDVKIWFQPQVANAHFSIQGRQISVDRIEGPTEITIFSLMGQMLEQYRISDKNATVTTEVPSGSYVVQVKAQRGVSTQMISVP